MLHVQLIKRGEILLVKKKNKRLARYWKLLTEYGVYKYGIKRYHYKMGKLYGYSDDDIKAFIDSNINCECYKCKGV